MSTNERYGNCVWDAIVKASREYYAYTVVWYTVGEIAEMAKVSKPTAKKYLEILVEKGHVEVMGFGKRKGYRLPAHGNAYSLSSEVL